MKHIYEHGYEYQARYTDTDTLTRKSQNLT